jgi:spermidine synthase
MKKNYIFKKNQWFFEKTLPGVPPVMAIGIKIKKKIFSGKSPYQKLEVFDTFPFGQILVLDGIIQLSKVDEFIYHEMLTHPAMFYYPNPQKVLIIGGGDGGALREVLKHPVEEVYLVDIDKKVIEVSQKYLPFVSKGAFKNKKARIFIEDGIKFVKKYKNFFDIIIVDSTDPSGPSLALFSKNFYQDAFEALTKNGILSIQSGCLFEQFFHLKKILKKIKKIFPSVKIHKACVPSLQCSNEFTFTISGKFDFEKVTLKDIEKRFKKLKLNLKYYNPEIHFSSTILPKYLKEKLK